MWPEKNGSFVVYWDHLDYREEKFYYQVCVFEGRNVLKVGQEFLVIDAQTAPQLIHPSQLGGEAVAGKVFTVSVRMKTKRVSWKNI